MQQLLISSTSCNLCIIIIKTTSITFTKAQLLWQGRSWSEDLMFLFSWVEFL